MYASKMEAAEAAVTPEDRQHTIEVLCELIAMETSEEGKEFWRRSLLHRDPAAYVKSYGRIN